MSGPEEKRQHERVDAGLVVEIRAERWRDVEILSAGNISRGGLFVGSERPLSIGTRIDLSLTLPDGRRLPVSGEVVHVIEPGRAQQAGMEPGFGVRFESEHTLDLKTVHDAAASQARGEPPPAPDALYITMPATLLIDQGEAQQVTRVYQLVEPTREPDGNDAEVQGARPSSSPPPPPDGAEPAATASGRRSVPQRTLKVGRDAIFGVDFGTAYTSVAVVAGGQLSVLKDDDGNTMFPSVVCYPEPGKPVVGWKARELMAVHPRQTITSPKRLIGRRYDDPHAASFVGSSAVPLSEGPNGIVMAELHGDMIAMPQICAEVLRHAADLAERATGQRVERALLSAPVGYTVERAAIKRAAELAQIKVSAIVDEPVAAAVGCGLGRRNELVGVYDFGGGTFDFTLLDVKGGQFRVIAKAGDAWLGGDDFDLALAEHAANAFWKTAEVDLRQRAVEWQRLLLLCEAAKRRLSTVPQVELLAKEILHKAAGPVDLRMTLTQQLLAELCGPLVARSIETVDQALQTAGVKISEIGHIAMTGGVSRTPLVRQKVSEYLGRKINLAIDPQHAVAVGTAVYANLLTEAVRKKIG